VVQEEIVVVVEAGAAEAVVEDMAIK